MHAFLGKKWVSRGSVYHNKQQTPGFIAHPRYGTIFEVVKAGPDSERITSNVEVPHWTDTGGGPTRKNNNMLSKTVELYNLLITQDDPTKPAPDQIHATDPVQEDYDAGFKNAVTSATFMRIGEILLTAPVFVPTADGVGETMTFIIEFNERADGTVFMNQYAYSSRGYIGGYCCT